MISGGIFRMGRVSCGGKVNDRIGRVLPLALGPWHTHSPSTISYVGLPFSVKTHFVQPRLKCKSMPLRDCQCLLSITWTVQSAFNGCLYVYKVLNHHLNETNKPRWISNQKKMIYLNHLWLYNVHIFLALHDAVLLVLGDHPNVSHHGMASCIGWPTHLYIITDLTNRKFISLHI